MSTVYLNKGTKYKPINSSDLNKKDILPIKTYSVKFDLEEGFFLEEMSSFKIEGKVYGDLDTRSDKILNTFKDRPNGTGVLLAGEKGSGKTMLAKRVSSKGRDQGMATIIVNNPFKGDNFNKFIQSIEQPCVVIFDEFEKLYSDREDQDAILTLLDGVFPSKKLFIMTVNETFGLSPYLTNRPGRLFYKLNYEGLDETFITEYVEANLLNKSFVKEAIELLLNLDKVNFDMMKALVEEVNRYDENPLEAVEMLNIDTALVKEKSWKVQVLCKGKDITKDTSYPRSGKITRRMNDMQDFSFECWTEDMDSFVEDGLTVEIFADHLIEYNQEQQYSKYQNGDYTLVLTPWQGKRRHVHIGV